MFSEVLPRTFLIDEFECGGFQDFFARFTIRMAQADGRRLLDALDATIGTRQDDLSVAENEKERRVEAYPEGTRTVFTLPGARIVAFRTVVVQVPNDEAAPVLVTFDGSQL